MVSSSGIRSDRGRNSRATGGSSAWRHLIGLTAVVGAVAAGLVPARAVAQTGQPGVVPNPKHQQGALLGLGQNYPSPFSATTRIPFTVGDPPTCPDNGRHYRVSLQIYNLLAQVVAVPVMAEGGTSVVPVGEPVQSLTLPCGQYTAYWDGTGLVNNRAVASGMYLYRLEVNGKAVGRKMLIQR
jgi:hypothetical protein